jgi:hypothetical protein
MKLRPYCEAASRSATREIPKILWNPKLHYRVHKSQQLDVVLSQINPVHTNSFYLCKFHFSSSILTPTCRSFLLSFPLNPLLSMRATCIHPSIYGSTAHCWTFAAFQFLDPYTVGMTPLTGDLHVARGSIKSWEILE